MREDSILPATEQCSEVKIDIITSTEKHENMIHITQGGTSEHQHLLINRLTSTGGGLSPSRQASFGDSRIGHAVADTFLCTRLGLILLKYLGIGYRWMISLAALFIYGLFIMPGILQVARRYFFDKRIHRGVAYGPEPRNRLDLYLPDDDSEAPKPVVAFVSGGAWVIGYKAWGSLLALQLVEEGVIVVCIDYRNFPQGTISDMVEDVSQGISFICNNIANYGGDLNRLYLIGQSAGAHLGACTLLAQAKKESELDVENDASLQWRASQFKAYIGISGGYNLYKLADHFHNKGMYRSLFFSIMEGVESLAEYSPELCLQSLSAEDVNSLLPPIYLFHGTDDHSIPYNSSTSFVEALQSAGAQASTRLYEGKSHTDLFLQDPMRGGHNELLEDILIVMELNDKRDPSKRLQPRMVPECCLQIAHKVSPF